MKVLHRTLSLLAVVFFVNVLSCAAIARAQESTPTSPLATPAIEVTPTPTSATTDEVTPTLTQQVSGADCANVSYGNLTATEPISQPIPPPNPNGPTAVDVTLNVKDISDIDASADSYAIEGFMDVVWCDPRLQTRLGLGEIPNQDAIKTLRGKDVEAELAKMWWPALSFSSLAEPMTVERPELQIRTDGTVQYRAKFQGVMTADYALHAFPFDRQQLALGLRSFTWPSNALVIQPRDALLQVPDDLEIPEWRYLSAAATVEETKEEDERAMFSTLQATFSVQRSPGAYLSKILIPLAVITLLTMAIFWLDGDSFDTRLGGGMTGLLTSIAYQFIASDSLPSYVFNTYLDAFIWMSFIWIVVALAESGFVAFLHKTERGELAIKTDQIARWLVPALYVLSLVVLYFIYTRVLA